jgi:hypothetical protein
MKATNIANTYPPQYWVALSEELDRWSSLERKATFWWRDDDAAQPCAALDRLLDLATRTPLALAVIPVATGPALAKRLAIESSVTVMQHGFAHTNHAPTGDRKAEFGQHRSNEAMVEEIAQGAALLRDTFRSNLADTFVPPWNRIADGLAAHLSEAGIATLSSIGPRLPNLPLSQLNVHVDIIDWRGHRGFRGSDTIDCMVEHLSQRRLGLIDATEVTGLLTHHLDHDDACWAFVADLLSLTAAHPAALWTSTAEALASQ